MLRGPGNKTFHVFAIPSELRPDYILSELQRATVIKHAAHAFTKVAFIPYSEILFKNDLFMGME